MLEGKSTLFILNRAHGANLTTPWFGLFSFDSSELPIITIYAFYIPIFINWMIKEKAETKFRRFVLPIMAIIACVFMVFCAIMGHGVFPCQQAQASGEFAFPVLFYLIVFAAIMLLGWLLDRKNKNNTCEETANSTVLEDKQEEKSSATAEQKEESLEEEKPKTTEEKSKQTKKNTKK